MLVVAATGRLRILTDSACWATPAPSGRFADARQALDEGLAVAERNDEHCYDASLSVGRAGVGRIARAACRRRGVLPAGIEIARRQQGRAGNFEPPLGPSRA
jgi:hypothetical protein